MRPTPLQPVQVRRRRTRRAWPWAAGALTLAAVAAAGTGLVRAASYSGKALPGTRIVGSDVAGRTGADLERRVLAVTASRLARPVTVIAGTGRLTVTPSAVLELDVVRTAAAARHAGRGSLWTQAAALLLPLPPTREVQPLLRVKPDGLAALAQRLGAFATPPREAAVLLAGTTPRAVPGRAGTVPDSTQLVARLKEAVLTGSSPVTVAMRPAVPAIGMQQAMAAVAEVERLLAAPVQLRVGGIAAGELAPSELAKALRIEPAGTRFATRLDAAALWLSLRERIARFRSKGSDARFAIRGDAVRVVPAVDGLDVAQGTAARAVLAAMQAPARVAALQVVPVPASLSTAAALQLGITRKIASYTTQMGNSSANRIQNVHLMADFIDGTLVRPGETFSFNEVVGPRTEERGFLVGQALFGSVAVASIGGGVCQTATTLFNDAFNLGLPILSRLNHSSYIEHYPVGRDATVSWGGPDLVFRNDLASGLLIRASYTQQTLTFTVYGAPTGRRVVATTGPRSNVVPPALHYALDLNAAPGSVKLSPGSGAPGFDVTVSRKVFEHGKLLRADSFRSHYLDVGPTKIFGPGQVVPRPYIVIPKENV